MKHKYLSLLFIPLLLASCGSENQEPNTPTPSDEITNVVISKNPDKVTYEEGECFDPSGLEVTISKEVSESYVLTYNDIKDEVTFNPSLETPLTTENTSVSMSYSNYSLDIVVTVNKKEATYKTYTFDFENFEFEGGTKEISNTGNNPGPKMKNAFIKASGNELSEEDFDITCSGYVGIRYYEFDSTDLDPIKVLQLSSQEKDGILSLDFHHEISSIKIKAQSYYKAYLRHWELPTGVDPYVIYSTDWDTSFEVNGESWELPAVEYNDNYEVVEMPKIEEKTFEGTDNVLTIEDYDDYDLEKYRGRIFIYSIEVTVVL